MFFISFLGIIISNNIVKSIIFILLMQTSIVMFWLKLGIGSNALPTPPIIHDPALLDGLGLIADPLPQALTLTAIIIGFSVIAIVITMLNTLFRQHMTTNWQKMEAMEEMEVGRE